MRTQRLAFSQLHEELEVLERGSLRKIIGGDAPVIWGTDSEGNLYWRAEGGHWRLYEITLHEVSISPTEPDGFDWDSLLNMYRDPLGLWQTNGIYGGGGGNGGGGTPSGPSPADYGTGFNPDYVNMFFGEGEVAFGVYAAIQTGGLASAASYYMIADGLARMGLSLNADGPSNIGGCLGSFYGPDGQKWGELTNDGITAVVSGGAFATLWETFGAFSAGDYYLGSYFLADYSNQMWQVSNILHSHFIENNW